MPRLSGLRPGIIMTEKNSDNNAFSNHHDLTLEVLFDVADAVNRTPDLNEFYGVIHGALGRILNVDNFYIAIYNPQKDSITFPYWVDEKDKPQTEIFNVSKTASLTGKVIKAKMPLIIRQKEIVEQAKIKKKKLIGTPSKIWLGAPLKIRGKVTGALAVQSYTSSKIYKKSDLDILNLVAQHIALAIERKQSDEELQNQRQILEKILEVSPVGIALVQNRVFKWVNNEMVKIFGYNSKLDFQEKSAQMIYSSLEDYHKAGETIYSNLVTRGKADFEIPMIRKDGTIFPGNLQLNSADPSNPMAWTIAIISDISVRKNAEEEKIKREKLQGVLEMAGAVCHELNQPLQAILGYTELILVDQPTESRLYKDLFTINNQITRIGEITKRLSGITKYKTVDYPGNKKIVDIWESSKQLE